MKTKITITFMLIIFSMFSVTAETAIKNTLQKPLNKTAKLQVQLNGANGFGGFVFEESPKGKKLADATIVFTSEDKKLIRKVITDKYGHYKIALPVARYYVTVIHSGHEKYMTAPGFFVITKGKFTTGNFFLKKKLKKTYVPDNGFEQRLIDLGYDNVLDDYVLTATIEKIKNFRFVNVSNFSGDYTGLEDFINLINLEMSIRGTFYSRTIDLSKMLKLESLKMHLHRTHTPDISKNLALKELSITTSDASIGNLNLKKHLALESLSLDNNSRATIKLIDLSNHKNIKEVSITRIQDLDLSNCIALEKVQCKRGLANLNVTGCIALTSLRTGRESYFSSLNLSNCTALKMLYVQNNSTINQLDLGNNPNLKSIELRELRSLNSLNLKNGKPKNINDITLRTCPSLTCVTVDNPPYSTAHWTNKDPQIKFSENCNQTTLFKLYPNPFKHELVINIQDYAIYTLFTVNGEMIMKGELTIGENYLDFSKLKKGAYYINITTEKEVFRRQLIKN